MAPQLFVRNPDGNVFGPYSETSMRAYIAEGRVASPSLVRAGAEGAWMEVEQASRWLDAQRTSAPPPPAPVSRTQAPALPTAGKPAPQTIDAVIVTDGPARTPQRGPRRFSYRGYSWMAAAGCVAIALLLSYGLDVRASRCAPLYLTGIFLFVFGALAPRAVKGPLITWGAKPWAPKVARTPAGRGALPSHADSGHQASETGMPAKVSEPDGAYYDRSDSTGDMVLGGIGVVIGAIAWLLWFKAGAHIPPFRVHRGLIFVALPFFIFPLVGSFVFGRGLVWRLRERSITREQVRSPS